MGISHTQSLEGVCGNAMSSELILAGVIAILSALLAWDRHENRKENHKMIQAIMSKSVQDLKDFELTERVTIASPQLDPLPDMTEVSELDDKEFEKFALDSDRREENA